MTDEEEVAEAVVEEDEEEDEGRADTFLALAFFRGFGNRPFDEAEVDDADLIGGAGNGWAVTQTTLFYERSGIGAGGAHSGFPTPGPKGGFLGRRAADGKRTPK